MTRPLTRPTTGPVPRRGRGASPVALLLAGLTLAGCSHNKDDLNQYIQEVNARKTRDIEPVPQIRQFAAFAYVPAGRRDPFLSLEPAPDSGDNGVPPSQVGRNRQALESFPLDGLKMLGTISRAGALFAMVRAPDNVVHLVQAGDYMGQNYGRVTRVTDTEISLDEIVPDGSGGWQEQPASLALAE